MVRIKDGKSFLFLEMSPLIQILFGFIFQHADSKFDVSSLSKSDSASSTQSMQHGGMPELLIGLSYNGTTGRLLVEVIKGSNFKNMAMSRAPGRSCFQGLLHALSDRYNLGFFHVDKTVILFASDHFLDAELQI